MMSSGLTKCVGTKFAWNVTVKIVAIVSHIIYIIYDALAPTIFLHFHRAQFYSLKGGQLHYFLRYDIFIAWLIIRFE